MTKLYQLHEMGQSTWLNYMRREFITSGGLRECLEKGIQGITANAAVFEDTISHYTDYDQDIQRELRKGTSTTRIHEKLMIDDVQRAADMLHPVYEESDGLDGYASIEIDPQVCCEPICAVGAVRRLLAQIDRGNVMVEIPATREGIEAMKALTNDGICYNATHIFSISVFERVAQAYIDGLEDYFATHSVWRKAPNAVASFSVGAIDSVVNEGLLALERPDLLGVTGIVMARVLYTRFCEIFAGPRWDRLAARGARVLRPKWTALKPSDPAIPDNLFADALIGENTVITFTQETLENFLACGSVEHSISDNHQRSQAHLAELAALGIDLEVLAEELQEERLEAADKQYQSLIQSVIHKLLVGVNS